MDKLNNLDKRLTKLEKKLHISNKNSKRTDEVAIGPLLKMAAPYILKYLPKILAALPELIKFYNERDMNGNNKEKIDMLTKIVKDSEKFDEVFKDDQDLNALAEI
jgi:hypothetical protein